jgi:hypothetical protein
VYFPAPVAGIGHATTLWLLRQLKRPKFFPNSRNGNELQRPSRGLGIAFPTISLRYAPCIRSYRPREADGACYISVYYPYPYPLINKYLDTP